MYRRFNKSLLIALNATLLAFCLCSSSWAQTATQQQSPSLTFLFEETVLLAEDIKVGETPYGKRNIIPIIGGSFSGPNIKGTIMPGGWDWQLITERCVKIAADYMIKTDDGVIINIQNKGRFCQPSEGEPIDPITTPVFDAPIGKYDHLNSGAYVGTLEGIKVDGKPAVRIMFYRASL